MNALVTRFASSAFVREDLRTAVLPWIVARVLVFGSLGIAHFVTDDLRVASNLGVQGSGLFVYDGGWYRDIAADGYANLPGEAVRFFPLFPLLGRVLGTVLAGEYGVALYVVAGVASLLTAALLHRLVLRETGDAWLAQGSAWFVAVFPGAIASVLPYAEPLLLAAAVGMFLSMRGARWLLAAALGFAAGLTRPVGVLLALPAAVEAWRGWRGLTRGQRAERLVAIGSAPLGGLAYLAWVGAEFGDPLRPLSVQGRAALRGDSVDPVTHVVHTVRDLAEGDRLGGGMHLVFLVAFIGLAVILARRLPAPYAIYAGANVVLATTAENISSFERYAFSAFPFAIGLAIVAKDREIRPVVVALSAGGLVGYSVLTFLELYVV